MARITPSALVASIKGKIRGDCFQVWKSTNIMRSNPSHPLSGSLRAVEYRSTVAEISPLHYGLTALQKIAWNSYALLLPSSMSGFNAFLARNTALVLATHADLTTYFNAPASYNPPSIPSPLGLCYYPASNTYCLYWGTPNCVNMWVQGFYAPQTKFSNQAFPKYRFFQTVRSDALRMIFDASSYPSETMIRFTARAINVYGEISSHLSAVPPPELPPDLALLSPNGGEWYYFGQSVDITWRSKNIDTINIGISFNGGVFFQLISNDINAASGVYHWTVPSNSSTNCLIRIIDTDDNTHISFSAAVFRISATPTLVLTSPVGGESWYGLSVHPITWTRDVLSLVSLYYSVNSGSSWTLIASGVDATLLTYDWTVPDNPGTQFRVKIVSDDDPDFSSESSSDFTVLTASPSLSPIANWIFKTAGYDVGNTRFTDQSGNGHHFTNYAGAVDSDHTTLDGSVDKINQADFAELSADRKKFSVAFWVKTSDSTGGIVGHFSTTSGTNGWFIAMYSSGFICYVDKNGDNSVYKRYTSSISVNDGAWHLVGFTFNNNTFKVYVDGVYDSAATKNHDNTVETIRDSPSTFVGGYTNCSGWSLGYLACDISKGWFWNDVLPDDDWTLLFDQGH